MDFRWDENKNRLNLRNHGLRFEEAQTVFDDPLAVSIVDPIHSLTEERWLTIGMSRYGGFLIVARSAATCRNQSSQTAN